MYLMEDMAKQNQIIFTTHSPYMLEEVEGNVFCIVCREGGSTIRTLEEETDEETLMPVRMRICSFSKSKANFWFTYSISVQLG